MMKKSLFTSLLLFFSIQLYAQHKTKKVKLPLVLNEISGLEKFNDSILIAINDSGNEPALYFINLNGKLLKKTVVTNAVNIDWEDLAADNRRNLYIADCGNNENNRKNLAIFKVNMDEAFNKDSIAAETISFTYEDQTEFPPQSHNRKFDCEAIYWKNDSLHLITKNTSSKPKKELRTNNFDWDRFPEDYVLSAIPGKHIAQKSKTHISYLNKVSNKGIMDLITGVDCKNDVVAVLTYSQLRTIRIEEHGNHLDQSKAWGKITFKRITQKEAILIHSENKVFIGAEKHRILGGPFLYTIDFK